MLYTIRKRMLACNIPQNQAINELPIVVDVKKEIINQFIKLDLLIDSSSITKINHLKHT